MAAPFLGAHVLQQNLYLVELSILTGLSFIGIGTLLIFSNDFAKLTNDLKFN